MRRSVMVAALATTAVLAYTIMAQPPGGGEGRPGRGFRPPPSPLMTALDADKDGEISAEEIAGATKALQGLDRNRDGKLTRDEAAPRMGRFGGPGMRRPPGRGTGSASFEGSPLPRDDAEKRILAVLDDLDKNRRRGTMNVPAEDGRLLRLLTEAVGARHVVEIGTSSGYSAIWFCLALRKTGGKLTTFEIDARRAGLARENFKRAGVDQIVTLVEGDAHQEVSKVEGPIDVVFLDADKEGYVDYLEKLLPLVRPGGLVVAHNMNTRMAAPSYVKAVTTNKDLETIFLHMDRAGVGVTLKKR